MAKKYSVKTTKFQLRIRRYLCMVQHKLRKLRIYALLRLHRKRIIYVYMGKSAI